MEFVGIEKLSLLDYDEKVSCVLFCEHCNFKCPFCHNSSLVFALYNKEIPFDEIISYLKKRIGILDAVVISGGEPTLMPDLKNKIKQIKDLGFLVKLDTNGSNPKIIKDLVENKLIDYVAMDVKNSIKKYKETTGCQHLNIENIIKSINYLKSGVIPYEFRTTLVKEFHNEVSIKELGELIQGAEKLFLQKFIASDECIDNTLNEIEINVAKKYKNILSNYVKNVELRGY